MQGVCVDSKNCSQMVTTLRVDINKYENLLANGKIGEKIACTILLVVKNDLLLVAASLSTPKMKKPVSITMLVMI